MKKISNTLIQMVYPMLISFFILIYVYAFIDGNAREVLELVSILLVIIFAIMFVLGLIFKIIEAVKKDSD